MRCEWNCGREIYLEINFILKFEWVIYKFVDCKVKCDIFILCIVDYFIVYFVNIEVWVEVENVFGKVILDYINFDFVYKVKFNLLYNLLVINLEELFSILKLIWINLSIKSVIRLKYNI